MHPLSIFPDLLTFQLFGPLLLRLAVGFFIFYIGFERYKKPYKWYSVIYLILAILLAGGLYTQLAALLSIFLISSDYYLDGGNKTFSSEKKFLYVLVKVILVSLLVTGPGFFAFDLPL